MKRFLYLCLFSLFYSCALGQTPEDALRMSYFRPSGTARAQAIGGAMGSLGGDISANYVNPAGLGFYKTGEVILSPGFSFNSSSTSYLSTNTSSPSVNNFTLGASGVVYGWATGPSKSTAVSLAVNRTADFNSHVLYQGNNNYSSGSQAYLDEFNNSGLSINDALSSPSLSYGTRSALYTYLIDTSAGGNGPNISQANKVLAAGGELAQRNEISSSGGITEIAIGLAGASKDKWYFGGSLGIPIVNYKRTTQYTETDPKAQPTGDFGSYTNTEEYSASGVGVNARLGVIFRPTINWRIGLAIHTPSFYSITDKVSTTMVTNTEAYAGTNTISSSALDQAAGVSNSLEYDLKTPWHFVLSGSYIFPGSLTEGKMGFITADVEYLTIKSSSYSLPQNAYGNGADNSYFDGVNSTIKTYYKNSFNFRLGGEYKIDALALRLGGSYSTNPYASTDLKANQATIGGGLGYRKKGIFVDLTYVEAFTNDVNFPYRLQDKDNVYSTVKQTSGSVILSVGFKF